MGVAFVRSLLSHGHRVVVFASRPPSPENSILPELQALGVPVLELESFDHRFIKNVAAVTFGILQFRVDLVVTLFMVDTKVAMIARLLTGVPVVVSMQNDPRFFGRWWMRVVKRIVLSGFVNAVGMRIIASSLNIEKRTKEMFWVSPSQIVTVFNGIDVRSSAKVGSREDARRSLGLDNRPLIVNVGRIDPQKGQLDLVKGFLASRVAREADARLCLIGGVTFQSDASEKYFEQVSEVLRLIDPGRVFVTGWTNDVGTWLVAADFYVQSSWWEGFSLASLEALAVGLPAVLSRTAVLPEGFLDGEHAVIVDRPTPDCLSAAMDRILLMSQGELLVMASNARVVVERKYDIRRSANVVSQLLAAVLQRQHV